jgi:ABC-type multidrug transport system fused ATPase/permease subunit
VYRNLDGLKNCTIIVIAHRLNTIANADLILVMDGGKLVETGRHADLMVRRGVYYTLVQDQANAAIVG